MRIFLTGMSCVGKTTVGRELAELLGVKFFDLDHEVEAFFGTSIERLQNKFLTIESYRNEAAKALVHLLSRPASLHSVPEVLPLAWEPVGGGGRAVIFENAGPFAAGSSRWTAWGTWMNPGWRSRWRCGMWRGTSGCRR